MHSLETFEVEYPAFGQLDLPTLSALDAGRNEALISHLTSVLPGIQQAQYARVEDFLKLHFVVDSDRLASFDSEQAQLLADRLALIFDSNLQLDISAVGCDSTVRAESKRDPRLLIPAPAQLQQRYHFGDCREVGLLLGELLQPVSSGHTQQEPEWFNQIEKILTFDEFKAPRLQIRGEVIELELANQYEDLLQAPLHHALMQLLDALPSNNSLIVLMNACSERQIIAELDPVNNVGDQDDISRAMRRNSADALLAESLPFSRVIQTENGLEVTTNFEILPEWTKQRLVTRLQQFGVHVRLVHETLQLEHSDDVAEQIGRCLRFCLPKSLWLAQIELCGEGIEVSLRGEPVSSQDLDQIVQLVEGVWQLPMKISVETLDADAVNELASLGRRHAAALARLADSDGVVRAPLQNIADTIEFELVRDVPEGTYRSPSEAITRGYPKVNEQFIAIGRPGSLQEDAFHIVSEKQGYQITVAIADASWLAPQESYIGHEMMAHGYSLYDRNVVVPSIPRHILDNHGGFSTSTHRPAVLVQMEIDLRGKLHGNPSISLGSIRLSREIHPTQYRELVKARANDDRFPMVNFSDLSDLLLERRVKAGGLVWFDEVRSVDEVQVLVNQILPAFALSKGIPQLVRAHPSPSLETRRSYLDRLLYSFPQLDQARFLCSDIALADDLQFRRRLHSMLNCLNDDSRREAFRLLRLGTTYSATPGETNFFQEGKVYAQYTGTFRRLAAKVNLEQVSRHLRGEPVRDQSEMERLEDYCRLLEYSMRHIGDTLRVGELSNTILDLQLINTPYGFRTALAPDLVAQFDSASQARLVADGMRAGDKVSVLVVGYDLKTMRALVTLA